MKFLCIIGPSGVGKSTIARSLQEQNYIEIIPSITDRPKRKGEIEIEHQFVSKQQFDELHAKNRLLDVVKPFNLPYRYGLPKMPESSNKVPVVMLRADFVPLFAKYYPDFVVYQIEAPYEFVKYNLERRPDQELGNRLKDYRSEVIKGRKIADIKFVNDSQTSVDDLVRTIIKQMKVDFNNI